MCKSPFFMPLMEFDVFLSSVIFPTDKKLFHRESRESEQIKLYQKIEINKDEDLADSDNSIKLFPLVSDRIVMAEFKRVTSDSE